MVLVPSWCDKVEVPVENNRMELLVCHSVGCQRQLFFLQHIQVPKGCVGHLNNVRLGIQQFTIISISPFFKRFLLLTMAIHAVGLSPFFILATFWCQCQVRRVVKSVELICDMLPPANSRPPCVQQTCVFSISDHWRAFVGQATSAHQPTMAQLSQACKSSKQYYQQHPKPKLVHYTLIVTQQYWQDKP